MAIGLTRREQWALGAMLALIFAGLGLHQWRGQRDERTLYIDGQGRWEKLADFRAGQAPPRAAAANAAADAPSSGSVQATGAKTPDAPPPGGVDLNTATPDELQRLPGIGPVKAEAIVQTRQQLGGFASVEQLTQTPGIGPKTLERLRPYLALSAPAAEAQAAALPVPAGIAQGPQALAPLPASAPPAMAAPAPPMFVRLNSAGPEELERLKGIGPVMARRIVEYRERNGPFRSVDELERVKGIGPKTLEKIRYQIVVN